MSTVRPRGDLPRSAGRRTVPAVVLDVALLTVVTAVVGVYCQAFTGFPKGYDAWGHLSKARMVMQGFPRINWNDEWYAGQPAFLGSYPPGYHLLLAATSRATGWSLPHAMLVLGAVAVITAVVGCYLLVLTITSSRAAALVSGGLLLSSPTLWDQVVELGLYPRFTAMAVGVLATGCAGLQRRRPTPVRATLTVVVLAASLGTHPVSGGIACGAVGLVLLCAATPRLAARAGRAVLTVVAAVALCGWFYVPLLLVPRSQAALTDVEVPLQRRELGWPGRGLLSTLPPVMLVGVVVVAAAVLWAGVELSWRARKITRLPPILVAPADPRGAEVSAAVLTMRLDAVVTQRQRRARGLPDVLVALGLTAAAFIAIGYGLVGYVVDRFPYYVNGLQPRDLLVYPAWLLSAALGIGGHLAVRHRRRVARAVTAAAAAVAVAGCLAVLVVALPSGVRDSSGAPTDAMIALLPAEAYGNDNYRIAGVSDLTSRWINGVTDTRQLRGYDDHGNLHLDRQYWLEQTLTAAPSTTTPQQRQFLLDYYAARWLLTDTPRATGNLASDPQFTALGRETVYADVTIWEYQGAHPVTTAVTAPTVLVVGDDAHYDLLLRVLALAGVGADRLLPVHGPATLAEVTAAQLRAYPTVLVYGATPGVRPASAAFAAYVRGGGRVVVDVGDSPVSGAVARAVGSEVTGTSVRSVSGQWQFTGTDAAVTTRWSPPLYVGESGWDVRGPDAAVGGTVLLAAHGTPVVVRTSAGDGEVVWSGMNLAYHALSFEDAGEATYLGRLLGAADTPGPVTPVPAERRDPQRRVVTLPVGVNQVLVREYVSNDWHASIGGRPVPLLAAGPDMMFVQVPDHTGPVTVHLDYRIGAAERTGIAVSLLAVLATLGYAVGGGPVFRRVVRGRARAVVRVVTRVVPVTVRVVTRASGRAVGLARPGIRWMIRLGGRVLDQVRGRGTRQR